jgi:putative PIN family toxin of toxin-antitoxin system
VLKRNKFKKFVSQEDLQEFISIHLKLCTMIELENIPDLLTDRKDNFLIALYRAGKATAMVTGDNLFIQEASNQKVNAITMAQFKQLSF